jgi:hypothetical protein
MGSLVNGDKWLSLYGSVKFFPIYLTWNTTFSIENNRSNRALLADSSRCWVTVLNADSLYLVPSYVQTTISKHWPFNLRHFHTAL